VWCAGPIMMAISKEKPEIAGIIQRRWNTVFKAENFERSSTDKKTIMDGASE
jgi:hypothetical protein